MKVTEEIIKDSFYKMYFYLPDVGEEKLSYKYCVKDFWKKYGVSIVEPSFTYRNIKEKKFFDKYSKDVTGYDLSIVFTDKDKELDMTEKQLNEAISKYIQEKQAELNKEYPCDRVNEHWKEHSRELLFLISERNSFKNKAIKEEVQKKLSEFNDDPLRCINELIQNADDCKYQADFNAFTILFDREKNEIKISYPEVGFTYADVISLSSINETNKMGNFEKATSTIGEKGRGFKSIFVYFKEVEILSGGFHFKYNVEEESMFQPLFIEGGEDQTGTKLTLKLRKNNDIGNLIENVKNLYGAKKINNLYRNNSIFFTRHFTELRIIFQGKEYSDLICIKNDHCIIDADTQDNEAWWDKPDEKKTHICKGYMSYGDADDVENGSVENYFDRGEFKNTYQINLIGMINYLEYPKNILENRFGKIENEDALNRLSKTMPIIMFGIHDINSQNESNTGNMNDFSGHMYTYLPTSVNLHLPFIFQVPFCLEENRSCPKEGEEGEEGKKWNNYLYDAIWGTKEGDTSNSIVKKWYEYEDEEKHHLVENIYNYLPQGKMEEVAFYSEEENNVNSNYATVAKGNIKKFNDSKQDRIKKLYKSIEIFKCWNCNDVVSISKLKIVDQALAMFDIEDRNLLWDAYVDTNPKCFRFEKDSLQSDSETVKSFNKFIGNKEKDLIVTAEEIFASKEMHEKIEERINELKNKERLDYIHKFTSTYIQKELWESIFSKAVEKMNETQKENIRKWGSNLLWFDLKTIHGDGRSFRYEYNEAGGKKLWLYNTSNEELLSIDDIENGIGVYIINEKCDSDIKSILFKEQVQNLKEVYDSIKACNNIALKEKIDIIGTYHFLKYTDDSVNILESLFRRVLKEEDLNQVEFPSISGMPEKTIEYQIEWETIKFRVWYGLNEGEKKKKPYKLDLTLLSEEIAKKLNPLKDGLIFGEDQDIEFKIAVNGTLLRKDDKENCTDLFKEKYVNIYVNPEYFVRLPERNILKFPNHQTLILKEPGALSEALESETKLSIDFVKEVRQTYDRIKNNKYKAPCGMKYELAVIKGIQAYQIYSLIDANDYRESIGNDGVVFNELLQNINDYIENGTNVLIQILENTDEKGVRIIYKEKEHKEEKNEQKVKKSGFQANDILSLISIGISPKKEKQDQYTGNKGIGFKNVYRIFDLVEVDSNGFRFMLDDSFLVDAERLFDDVSRNGIKSIQSDKELKVEEILESYMTKTIDDNIVEKGEEKTKFPIIQVLKSPIDKNEYFRLNNNSLGCGNLNEDSLTAFQFRFRKEKELYESFLAQLVGNSYVERILSKENIQKKDIFEKIKQYHDYNYRILFLHNCKSIYIEKEYRIKAYEIPAIVGETKNGFDESWVEDKNFWSNRHYLEDLNLLPDKSPRYMRKKNTEEDGVFKNVEVRFMKIPVIYDDKGEKALNCNGILYATLPLDIDVGGAVHINIPALETEPNRKHIIGNEISNQSSIGKWNRGILEKVFGPQGVFITLFNSFSEKYTKLIANYAFMYVPLDLYYKVQNIFPGIQSGIKELRCIPCMTYRGVQMHSFQEISQNKNIFKLNVFMYQWFDMMDEDFQKFYEKRNHEIEFIYMKDENNWNLVLEFAQDKYEVIRPTNAYLDDKFFFKYISDYWNLFYEGFDTGYQKECDKNFANRINMIAAETGIDWHYTKWNIWKKFYRQQEKNENDYIKNMIEAVCFGVDDSKLGFYFTVRDIKDCIGMEKLDIPQKIISQYKQCLSEKGYYNFEPYVSLLKKELQYDEVKERDFPYQLAIANQYNLGWYNPNQKDEIILPEEISEEKILKVIYFGRGVKRLVDLKKELPVLLLDGKFSEKESEYFIELPNCLFEENKTTLQKNQDYDKLLDAWVKKDIVVSRANIADVNNLYELDRFDEKLYEELLPYLDDSRMFFKLLVKNLSIMYDSGSQILKNILKFWYKKFTGLKNSEYFFWFASLTNVYLKNREEHQFNKEACSNDVEFDIRYLLHEGSVDICNEINKEDYYLEINIEPLYRNELIQYWNEIEMNLTDEQRNEIAKQYVGKDDQSAKIEEGIAEFLKHIYMCNESPALYSGYPSGKFLKVKVKGSEKKDYLIFADYTDAIIKLLKEEFDIVVKKSKYLPLGNLDEYNDLLPVGTQEEYACIKREITNALDAYTLKIEQCSDLDKKKQVKTELDEYKLLLLALQYQVSGNRKVKGYGKECPLLMTNDVVELRSLQCFEYPIFGFHIGITLFGSKMARDVITKYATRLQVCVENNDIKKKKPKRTEQKNSFSAEMGEYSFENKSVLISSGEVQKEQELQILENLVSMLDNIQNELILTIEMVTDKGTTKKERFILKLTHAHRALMVYEISNFMEKLL